MANPNPWQARLAKALREKAGTLEDAQRRIWGVLEVAYADVGAAADPDDRRRAMLCFVQVSATYLRLFEAAEMESRLLAVEAALKRQDEEA